MFSSVHWPALPILNRAVLFAPAREIMKDGIPLGRERYSKTDSEQKLNFEGIVLSSSVIGNVPANELLIDLPDCFLSHGHRHRQMYCIVPCFGRGFLMHDWAVQKSGSIYLKHIFSDGRQHLTGWFIEQQFPSEISTCKKIGQKLWASASVLWLNAFDLASLRRIHIICCIIKCSTRTLPGCCWHEPPARRSNGHSCTTTYPTAMLGPHFPHINRSKYFSPSQLTSRARRKGARVKINSFEKCWNTSGYLWGLKNIASLPSLHNNINRFAVFL